MANSSHELMTRFSPYYMSLFFSFEIYHEPQKIYFLERKISYSQHLAEPNLVRLFLILLLALCSRDFLILFEARQTCSMQIRLVSHYAGVFSPNGLVEPKNELGDESPWAWIATGQLTEEKSTED